MVLLALRGAASACLSFVCSAGAAWVWCTGVFAALGYSPAETALLAVAAAAQPALTAIEAILARFTPLPRSGPVGEAFTGFFLAAALAALWVAIVGESRTSFPNIADLVLAGLVFGFPAGVLSHWSWRAARHIVDIHWRVL